MKAKERQVLLAAVHNWKMTADGDSEAAMAVRAMCEDLHNLIHSFPVEVPTMMDMPR
jgi:hypothetical protein